MLSLIHIFLIKSHGTVATMRREHGNAVQVVNG